MKKRTDIITIIGAIVFVTSLSVGEALGYTSINFKSVWFYISLIVVISSVILACMDLKGKFKSKNTELAKRFYMQGLHFKMRGELNPAISNFKIALMAAPDFAPAHQSLGEIFLLQGKHKKAAKHFMKAQDLDFKESSLGTAVTKSATSSVGGVLTNGKYGFSVKSPDGWKIRGGKESKLANNDFVVEFIGRNAHIHVIAGKTNDVSTKDTEHNAIRNIHLTGANLESFRHIQLDGIEAIEAIYVTKLGTKIKKVGLVNNHIEFVITCGTTNKYADFGKYEPVFDKCLQSFKFTHTGKLEKV